MKRLKSPSDRGKSVHKDEKHRNDTGFAITMFAISYTLRGLLIEKKHFFKFFNREITIAFHSIGWCSIQWNANTKHKSMVWTRVWFRV